MKVFTIWKNGVKIDEAFTSTEAEKELKWIKSKLIVDETIEIKLKRIG